MPQRWRSSTSPRGKLRVQFLGVAGDADANQGEVLLDPDRFSCRAGLSHARAGDPQQAFERWPLRRRSRQAPHSDGHAVRDLGSARSPASALWSAFRGASRRRMHFRSATPRCWSRLPARWPWRSNNAMAFRQIAELRDRLTQEKQYLEEEINLEHRFDDIVGESTGLRNVLRADRDRRAHRCHRAHPGRNRNRQGAAGARHSPPEPAQRAHLHQVELRGHSRRPA